jgi:tetratricopeptide (TPR) repeat protein
MLEILGGTGKSQYNQLAMSSPKDPNSSDPKDSGSKPRVQWVLKSNYGEEIGPYTTDALIRLISSGSLQGDEKIRRFPHGRWIDISKQSEFYDSLLKVLEDSVKADPRAKRRLSTTQTVPSYEQRDEDTQGPKVDIPAVIEEKIEEKAEKPLIPYESTDFQTTSTPRMKDIPPPQPKNLSEKTRKMLMAASALVAVSAALAVVVLFYDARESSEEKPHLLSPRITQADTLDKKEAGELLRMAISSFLLDSYEGYVDSQANLVKLIEGAPKLPQNEEARGLLCLTHKQLWPYVSQDSQDIETIHRLAKVTQQKFPFGMNSVYCEVARLLMMGRHREAKGALDSALNQPQLSSAPVLYNLKAEILAGDHDPETAILYAEKAIQLWPEWVKPQFDYAQYLNQSKQSSAAFSAYQRTLKMNPTHKAAMIEMGIVQYRDFRQVDKALAQLLSALDNSRKVQNMTFAKAYLAIAEIYLEKVEPREALEYAQKSYDLNPGDVKSKELIIRLGGRGQIPQKSSQTNEIVFLGDQYFRSGDCLAAQAEYKAAYELDPSNGTAALKTARCLWQLNQSGEAIQWLNKAIIADKKLVSAYVLQADYYSQKFNYSAAIQVLNKASQIFHNNYEVIRGYGLVEYRRNNFKESLAFLQRSLKIYSNDIETVILLARVSAAIKEPREALTYSLKAIEIDSSNTEAQTVYAKSIAQLDGIDAGAAYLKNLIGKFSYTLDFRIALAELYRDAERHKVSQELYEQIVEADPRNKKAFLGLGESYQAQGLADKALKAYLSAAILDPSDAEAVFRTGLVYMEAEKYKEAIQQFVRTLQINPLYPRANYAIGRAYFKNDQYDEALNAVMLERKLNPSLTESYLLAAEIYASAKQYNKCVDEYQLALRLRPQGAELYVKIARCYRQSGNLELAENMLNLAANQESGMPDIYKEQGTIYEIKGDTISAVKSYNKYLALSPNAPDRNEIEAQIIKLSSGKR